MNAIAIPLILLVLAAIAIGIFYLYSSRTVSKSWKFDKDLYTYGLSAVPYPSNKTPYTLDQAKLYAQKNKLDVISYNEACPNSQSESTTDKLCYFLAGNSKDVDPKNAGNAAPGWKTYSLPTRKTFLKLFPYG